MHSCNVICLDVSQISDNPGRFSPMLKLTDAMHRTLTAV